MSTSDNSEMRARLTSLKEDVMTGVSFMIPFVTIGGIFLALGFAWASLPWTIAVEDLFETSAQGTVGWFLAQMGVAGLTIMVPILGAYIAYAIADRPGLAPGFMLSWIIQQTVVIQQSAEVLGLQPGQNPAAGYLGALVAGLLAGYVARWFKQRDVPSAIKPMMPVLIIPVATVAVLLPVMLFVIGVPVAIANGALNDWLGSIQGGQAALVGIVLGAMMAFDMGGPVNKVAYLFSVGLISEQIYAPMAAVMIAGMTPPLGMAISNFIARQKYPGEMYEQAKSSFIMGLSFITEGAIPYAAADPFRVIPSLMAGSAVAGALSMSIGVEMPAPHGGIFVAPLADPIWGFFVALIAGALVTAVMITVLKPDHVPDAETSAEATTAD